MNKIEYGTEFLDQLKDSVHDLYDENKELKKENRFQMKLIDEMNKNNDRLQAKINEAIEYIENNDLYYQDVDYDYEENMTLDPPSDEEARTILLSILKGEDNE